MATIVDALARQWAANPNHLAVVDPIRDTALTYAQLDTATRPPPGESRRVLVSVELPRSQAFVVAMIAILRSDGAFLPIDIDRPRPQVPPIDEASDVA